MEPRPWDQQPDESKADYARFLEYLNLGPSRSLRKASTFAVDIGDGFKIHSKPGNWGRACRKHRWVERALAWDIHHLKEKGQRMAVKLVSAFEHAICGVLEELENSMSRPKDFKEAVEALATISALLPPGFLSSVIPRGEQPDQLGNSLKPVLADRSQKADHGRACQGKAPKGTDIPEDAKHDKATG